MVTDVAPYWRPVLWAEATAVLDSVRWGADPSVMDDWTRGPARQAMVRSAIFRLLGDRPADVPALEQAVAPLLAAVSS